VGVLPVADRVIKGEQMDIMETYFAPVQRDSDDELKLKIEIISQNPVVDGLLDVVSGFMAVLNEHRQILALNETLLSMLGINSAKEALGLRPGEALDCIHAREMPGGCGTSRFCSTCGAAIALVTSLGQDRPVESACTLTVNRKGKLLDLFLSVRSYPIVVNGQRLLLLFLQDLTRQQQWAMLERVFFHDISNILCGLVGACELLKVKTDNELHKLSNSVYQLAVRLAQEVKIQQCLTQMDMEGFQSVVSEVTIVQILDDIRQMFNNHPVAKDKVLHISDEIIDISFKTDVNLLMRILGNMITNAFEATAPGEGVNVWLKQSEGHITFYVWNRQVIPEKIANRVFQRNFSTKLELGRGLGTYSIKLFGEKFLGGKVEFTSSEKDGTTFCFMLPV